MSGRAPKAATRDRVVAAARRCLAERGLRGTTVDDVAAAAGVSRATLYRAFPGGRETILGAVVESERAALLDLVGVATRDAGDLRGALVAALAATSAWLAAHDVVERLMFEEPAALLTHLEFEQMDRTLAAMTDGVAPLLGAYLDEKVAERVAEWATRLVVSYQLFPSDELDLASEEGARVLVDRHVLPGVLALAREGAAAAR